MRGGVIKALCRARVTGPGGQGDSKKTPKGISQRWGTVQGPEGHENCCMLLRG